MSWDAVQAGEFLGVKPKTAPSATPSSTPVTSRSTRIARFSAQIPAKNPSKVGADVLDNDSQVFDPGGKGGTRTLDPGIMRAFCHPFAVPRKFSGLPL